MLTKRIIPCLDVNQGKVVKGVQFNNHQIVGDILSLANFYRDCGADELVFYDITASIDKRHADLHWVSQLAEILDIPFCVAGGIRSVSDARQILNRGADKISINSPAIENPHLIQELADAFGQQCVTVGIDSFQRNDHYYVYQYTGKATHTLCTGMETVAWAKQVESLGAGEIVINCMNQDGMRRGYDIAQIKYLKELLHIPLIASGGAGQLQDFSDLFLQTNADGALAATVFHKKQIHIAELKAFLADKNIEVRL